MIIDTHTHIYLNESYKIDEIIENLENDNIKKIISIWIDLESSLKSIELAKKYPWIVYATVWIHPTDVLKYKDDLKWTINQLEYIIRENLEYVRWVWECGFDFFRINKENFEEEKKIQEDFFKAQISLAIKYSLPIIIHTRDAREITLEVLQQMNAKKFVLHCFSEDLDFAYKAIYYSWECMISFSWIVTFKNAQHVQNVAANIPLNKVLIETDCPYLAPQPVRWQENIPNYTKFNLDKIYELRNQNGKPEDFETVKQQIYNNSLNFFNLN